MRVKHGWILLCSTVLLAACQGDDDQAIIQSSTTQDSIESVVEEEPAGDKTIRFLTGVTDSITRGDPFNYYAIEGEAAGFERVTAIIEGTAVDIRNTDEQGNFTYPYPGPNVETEITFTTDPSVEYGQTGINLEDLAPESYITITFIPNDQPEVEEPSVKTGAGQPHTFRNDDSSIVEIVTVTDIEVIDAAEELNPIAEQMLKVDVQYVNDGTVTTYIAPNYFSAHDRDGHFLPLRYTHFWLMEVAPGQSFHETIYFDITDDGPYTIQFFDGAWEPFDTSTGTSI